MRVIRVLRAEEDQNGMYAFPCFRFSPSLVASASEFPSPYSLVGSVGCDLGWRRRATGI